MNHRFFASLVAIVFASLLLPAWAAGVIDVVQSPAWLDRGGLSVPATAGTALQAGDLLRTGKDGKLLLKLDEGSVVKLGENARFTIERAAVEDGKYAALFGVVTGAFRFTTQVLMKNRPRDVKIRVGPNATVGIRGTDLWGRGREDKDLVCLIEGKIDVTGNDGKRLNLDQPRQLFQSSRNAPPEPLAFVDPVQLEAWAAETEIDADRGAAAGAAWKVVIRGFAARSEARSAVRTLRAAGYPASITGNTIVIDRFRTERAAENQIAHWQAVFPDKEFHASR